MSPERRLGLIEAELARWVSDQRSPYLRDLVHRDRLERILGYREATEVIPLPGVSGS